MDPASVTAVLGPTNTGKTHRAVEQMLEHRSGMIGLPLRLLAREVYDRVSARVGEGAVALVTGEEKRVPAAPRYWVCTVESMPVERAVDFLAVDEIQLAAHRQRGHVFTDRLLRARGRLETWFLGAWTIAGMIRAMVPEARIDGRPRFSRLLHAGVAPLSALRPRAAIVAFSAAQVYELAERVRRRRGGAAVVLGALSPRTRNAQVAMYQAGEVDYLVATDAIGMGLNMDVDHVAFAALGKFDGREARGLDAAELAQIAGRAGRYQSEGTFGTLEEVGPLAPSVAAAIESHSFAEVTHLIWRSADHDLSSVDALIASLRQPPPRPGLRRIEHADDFEALCQLARSDEVRRRASTAESLALLWDVCRIPDYRKLLLGSHVGLLAAVFEQLVGPRGRLDPGWMDRRIRRLADTEGDIDTLMARIAGIRTWTYIAHHAAWVDDAAAWQEETQSIENDLSDALHARLTERFVARVGRAQHDLGRRPASAGEAVDNPFRRLAALQLPGAAAAAVVDDEAAWVERLIAAPHEGFAVDSGGAIAFEGRGLGNLGRGPDILHPEVRLAVPERVGAGARARIHRRLVAWSRDLVTEVLGPLDGEAAASLGPGGRGLVFQLGRGLGTILRGPADAQVRDLRPGERERLERLGVRFGAVAVWLDGSLEPARIDLRIALARAFRGEAPAPPSGAVAFPRGEPSAAARLVEVGFVPVGAWVVRADVLDRVHAALVAAAAAGASLPPLASWLGRREGDARAVVAALGFEVDDDGRVRVRTGRRREARPRRGGSGGNVPGEGTRSSRTMGR